jgi:uncharacterized protein (DUF433 family)
VHDEQHHGLVVPNLVGAPWAGVGDHPISSPLVVTSYTGARCRVVDAGGPYHRHMTFDRITVDPDLMGGAPTIRGLRIPVATVVSMVADGMSVDEICSDLPDLSPTDVAEALRYAAETVRERRLPLRPSA